MLLDLVVGIFTLSNAFIALFIVIYAFLFLKKTSNHRERRPWDYLFVSSIIYLLFTMMLMLLQLYQINQLFGLGLYELTIFFQFIYTGLILLAFISQTDLIFKNEIIIITRKLDKEEKKSIDKDDVIIIDENKQTKKEEIIAVDEKKEKVETGLNEIQNALPTAESTNITPEVVPEEEIIKKPTAKKRIIHKKTMQKKRASSKNKSKK